VSVQVSQPAAEPAAGRRGLALACGALIVGLLYAAISIYWGLGGTWLLSTVGGSLGTQAGDSAVLGAAAWAAAVLKLVAAVLPLAAVGQRLRPGWNRVAWLLAWAQAAILILYGLVLTAAGLLLQAGVIHPGPGADHRALAWHAYLWDPWFLVWGLLVAGALARGRGHRSYPRPR
jgi:Protein of unknown function (DUF3995)